MGGCFQNLEILTDAYVGSVGGSLIFMFTDAYGVCRWVGLKYQNAYGCLRWYRWVGLKFKNAYGCLRWVWVGGLELSICLRMLKGGWVGRFSKNPLLT